MIVSAKRRSVVMMLAAWFLLAVCPAAIAVERHALVIGNSNYKELPLINPRNDASDMVSQLIVMGYKVYKNRALLDLNRQEIEAAMRAFADQLPDQANALFYFAGHGMANEDDNYMIPLDHNLVHEGNLRDRAVSLRATVDLMKRNNPAGLNIVLLDACRNNPLPKTFRSIERGLSRLNDLPQGIFVGYAADSGQVAEDGVGRNGAYTAELLAVMRQNPDLIIELAHKLVAESVFKKTNGKQFPVSENKVYGEWCFGICGSEVIVNLPPATVEQTNPTVASRTPAPEPVSSRRGWWIAGGVVAALLVGALAQSGGGGGEGTSYVLELDPPE